MTASSRDRLSGWRLPFVTASWLLLAVLACTYEGEYKPVSEQATLGVPVAYELYTECGLAQSAVDFDASMWTPIGVEDSELQATPAGVNSPFDEGTLTLVSEDRAVFLSKRGRTFEFRRHEGSLRRRDC